MTHDFFQAVKVNGSFGAKVNFDTWTTLAESINI
jgi:hypothetical protein